MGIGIFSADALPGRSFCGQRLVIEAAARESGVSDDLGLVLGHGRASEVLAMAAYLTCERHSPAYRQGPWARIRGFEEIPSQRASELFALLGQPAKEGFCAARAARLTDGERWYYDTTSISSYSDALSQFRWGRNKDGVALAQINLGMTLGAKSRLPFYYRKTAGNVADVTTLRKLMGEAAYLDAGKTRFCMDRGFYSNANIDALMSGHMKFVIGAKVRLAFVREAIDGNADAVMKWENYDLDQMRYALRVPIAWKHEQTHALLGTVAKSDKRAFLHLFSPKRKGEEAEALHVTLALLHRELEADARLDAHEDLYAEYFARQGRGWVANEQAISDKLACSGWFAMLTNDASLTCAEIDRLYSDKDRIEKAFGNVKERLDCLTTSVSSGKTLDGKLFCTFVGLILTCWVKETMQASGLANDYTLDSMLDEVEAVEMFNHEGRRPALGEITAKQRNIFEKLKVDLPALSQ